MERWGIVARDPRPGGGEEPRARDPQPEGALPHARSRSRTCSPRPSWPSRSARSTARRRPTARPPSCSPRSSGPARTPSTTSSSAASGSPSPSGYYTTFFDETNDFLGFRATREAAAVAYRQAGITDPRGQLDLVECHDCFTVTELVNTEDLGLCGRGEGGALLECGATAFGGDIPVNLSGGLQSCGHPVGATGVRMIAEIGDHVLGRAGERQVEGARLGAAHTLGGPGAVSTVCVVGAAE